MKAMDCTETRTHMLAARRDLLPAEQAHAVRAHLAECAACTQADVADSELSNALNRLPKRSAPDALRLRLATQWAPRKRRWPQRLAQVAAGATLATAIAAGTLLVVRSGDRSDSMFTEAVNDHLRVLYSDHAVEIESGGIHQVKPWFAGRLDFAPTVGFAGDADFPLKGGSVAYFMDRKAATFIFSRRLHTITLFVFRADGLPWPASGGEALGAHRVYARPSRGFRALMWRDGDLGYALVSDVAEADLRDLAGRIESAK
jgi:anti-sigma factor RsiW